LGIRSQPGLPPHASVAVRFARRGLNPNPGGATKKWGGGPRNLLGPTRRVCGPRSTLRAEPWHALRDSRKVSRNSGEGGTRVPDARRKVGRGRSFSIRAGLCATHGSARPSASGGAAGAALAASSAAARAASAALSGWRARLSLSLMIAHGGRQRSDQGSRIASPMPRSAPETRYIMIERVPIWMSPASVMPGIKRKSFGTSRRLTSFSATRAL